MDEASESPPLAADQDEVEWQTSRTKGKVKGFFEIAVILIF